MGCARRMLSLCRAFGSAAAAECYEQVALVYPRAAIQIFLARIPSRETRTSDCSWTSRMQRTTGSLCRYRIHISGSLGVLVINPEKVGLVTSASLRRHFLAYVPAQLPPARRAAKVLWCSPAVVALLRRC